MTIIPDLVPCNRCGHAATYEASLRETGTYGPARVICASEDHCIETPWLDLGGADPRPAVARQWNRVAPA